MIDHYDWAGGREAMVRLGPADGPVAIVALPLFEEANRTRTFAVGLMRRLADRGIATALPDLPGTGESVVPTENARLDDWRAAFAAAGGAAGARFGVAIRSGALLDRDAGLTARWQLSPQDGPQLVRELDRLRVLGGQAGDGAIAEIAGNRISAALLDDLAAAAPAPARTVRLDGDPRPADRSFPAGPLWRRVEPDDDPVLAAALADDIADWIATCAA